MTRLAGVELGGTKIIAAIAEGRTIISRERWDTGRPDETLPSVNRWLAERHAEVPFDALGIASFGPVRVDPAAVDYGHILATPKPGWAGADVRALCEGLGVPVAIDTDVNAAALAEARWGAGKGTSSLVYLTIGTGIGAGVLVDGRPLHGALHPEVGHVRLRKADDFAGVCPVHGDCAEGLLSGPALRRRFGRDPSTVPFTDLGPPARDLAELFAVILLSFSPNRLLVGGGVGIGLPTMIDSACDYVPAILNGYLPDLNDAAAVRRVIRPPALGEDAGPLGAIAVAAVAL